jgi:hypothetical protein
MDVDAVLDHEPDGVIPIVTVLGTGLAVRWPEELN